MYFDVNSPSEETVDCIVNEDSSFNSSSLKWVMGHLKGQSTVVDEKTLRLRFNVTDVGKFIYKCDVMRVKSRFNCMFTAIVGCEYGSSFKSCYSLLLMF